MTRKNLAPKQNQKMADDTDSDVLFSDSGEEMDRSAREFSPVIPFMGEMPRASTSFYGLTKTTPKRTTTGMVRPSTIPKPSRGSSRLLSSQISVSNPSKAKSTSPFNVTSQSMSKEVDRRGKERPPSVHKQVQPSIATQSLDMEQQETSGNEKHSSSDEDLANQLPQWCMDEYCNSQSKVRQDTGFDCDETSSDSEVETGNQCSQQVKKKRRISDFQTVQSSLDDVKCILEKLCEKVERNEKCLKEIQQSRQASCISSSESSSSTKKQAIPLKVRQEVCKVYRALLDGDEGGENFSGWYFGEGYSIKSKENEAIINKLVKEVKGLNPSFDGADIRDAAYRFYKTKCEEASLKKSGKAETKKVTRRRHERIIRKRKEREAAVLKNGRLTEDQRKKWLSVITSDYMSSEESDSERIIVHPIPWRSDYVNRMFKKIDAYCSDKKSPQARRQTKARVSGSPSTRSSPGSDAPEWAIRK